MTEPRPPWYHQIFRIRTRLLAASVLLVILPVAGLSFARTFERELLRSEEEGMTSTAVTLAAGAGLEGLEGPLVRAQAERAARQLRAQIRLLDREGRAALDTGPEAVEKVTAGRRLLPSSMLRGEPIVVGDPPPDSGSFAERAEVKKALGGQAGRFTRVSNRLRSVRLFVAEPIRRPDGSQLGVVYLSRTTYPVLVSMYRIRNGLVRVVAASLLVALVVALYQALTISRPLARLTDAARRIAAGERGVALRLSGRDEAAELARAFDTMARELDTRLNYISELAANVSHEFKTPIASIRAAAEVLRDGAAEDPPARERFLSNILADTDRLSRLVTRLLELSRIEAHLHDQRETFDIKLMLEEITERYEGADCPVVLEFSAPFCLLLGNQERLASAVGNLVDNALRVSPPERPVRVAARQEQGGLRVEVRDEGPGISAANLPRVWDRFFTTRREDGGTGLGLSIVKAVAEAHGGRVGASSEPGEGSTFWLWIPRGL